MDKRTLRTAESIEQEVNSIFARHDMPPPMHDEEFELMLEEVEEFSPEDGEKLRELVDEWRGVIEDEFMEDLVESGLMEKNVELMDNFIDRSEDV